MLEAPTDVPTTRATMLFGTWVLFSKQPYLVYPTPLLGAKERLGGHSFRASRRRRAFPSRWKARNSSHRHADTFHTGHSTHLLLATQFQRGHSHTSQLAHQRKCSLFLSYPPDPDGLGINADAFTIESKPPPRDIPQRTNRLGSLRPVSPTIDVGLMASLVSTHRRYALVADVAMLLLTFLPYQLRLNDASYHN